MAQVVIASVGAMAPKAKGRSLQKRPAAQVPMGAPEPKQPQPKAVTRATEPKRRKATVSGSTGSTPILQHGASEPRETASSQGGISRHDVPTQDEKQEHRDPQAMRDMLDALQQRDADEAMIALGRRFQVPTEEEDVSMEQRLDLEEAISRSRQDQIDEAREYKAQKRVQQLPRGKLWEQAQRKTRKSPRDDASTPSTSNITAASDPVTSEREAVELAPSNSEASIDADMDRLSVAACSEAPEDESSIEFLFVSAKRGASDSDIVVLEQVRALGHFPRKMDSGGSRERRDEHNLMKKVRRLMPHMSGECQAFLSGMKCLKASALYSSRGPAQVMASQQTASSARSVDKDTEPSARSIETGQNRTQSTASSSERASEPAVPGADLHELYQVALKNATPQHAVLLEKVNEIGQFPQRIARTSGRSYSEMDKKENNLRQSLDKARSSMHKTCQAFLRALQDETTQHVKRQKQTKASQKRGEDIRLQAEKICLQVQAFVSIHNRMPQRSPPSRQMKTKTTKKTCSADLEPVGDVGERDKDTRAMSDNGHRDDLLEEDPTVESGTEVHSMDAPQDMDHEEYCLEEPSQGAEANVLAAYENSLALKLSRMKQKPGFIEAQYWKPGMFSTLLYSILFYSILFYSILFYSTLLYSSLLYSTLLYSTLLYSTLFYSTLFYSTLFYSILFYSTILYPTHYTILS